MTRSTKTILIMLSVFVSVVVAFAIYGYYRYTTVYGPEQASLEAIKVIEADYIYDVIDFPKAMNLLDNIVVVQSDYSPRVFNIILHDRAFIDIIETRHEAGSISDKDYLRWLDIQQHWLEVSLQRDKEAYKKKRLQQQH